MVSNIRVRNAASFCNWQISQPGAFWIVQGTSMIPWFSVGTNYSPTGNTLQGMHAPEYNATVGTSPWIAMAGRIANFVWMKGLYYIVLAFITAVFLVCSVRINICLFCAILFLVVTFSLIGSVHFQVAAGHTAMAAKIEIVSHYYNLGYFRTKTALPVLQICILY